MSNKEWDKISYAESANLKKISTENWKRDLAERTEESQKNIDAIKEKYNKTKKENSDVA